MPQESVTQNSPDKDKEFDPLLHVQSQASTNDVDALLDEIDSVLEENASDFVRGFVQKGGQ